MEKRIYVITRLVVKESGAECEGNLEVKITTNLKGGTESVSGLVYGSWQEQAVVHSSKARVSGTEDYSSNYYAVRERGWLPRER